MPTPPPIGSHSFLCRGVAPNSRGNQTRGTDTVRPSSRTTVSECSEHDTSTANVSWLSTKVGIPFLQEKISILQHKSMKNCQFVIAETAVRGQRDRIEPELRITPERARRGCAAALDLPDCRRRTCSRRSSVALRLSGRVLQRSAPTACWAAIVALGLAEEPLGHPGGDLLC